MTYFPTEIMKNILAYCDDRVEQQQKKGHSKCLNMINRMGKDWYYRIYLNEKLGYNDLHLFTDHMKAEWFNLNVEDEDNEPLSLEENLMDTTIRNILFDERP